MPIAGADTVLCFFASVNAAASAIADALAAAHVIADALAAAHVIANAAAIRTMPPTR